MTEAGYPFSAYAWYGIFAQVGTPPAIVSRLNAEVGKLLVDPLVKERLAALNMTDAPPHTPQQFGENVHTDYATWGQIIRDIGLKLD